MAWDGQAGQEPFGLPGGSYFLGIKINSFKRVKTVINLSAVQNRYEF